jgi:hypothetical protein
MGYTTLGVALYWLEEPTGLTVKDNRCELVEKLNRVRQHAYLLYGQADLFMDGEECITVEEFPLDCNCKETYTGITLPEEYQTVEAIWKNDVPIKMFDKWREYRDGIKSTCSCKLSMYDVESFFPTERELSPCGSCHYVKIKAENPADCGKVAIIRYTDSNGQQNEDEILLTGDYVRTSRKVLRINPRGGVILPPRLSGAIYIADESGRILSEYDPSQHVPSFRRMKLTGVCAGDQVLVKASRKFKPLYFDTDVIESDNRLAIEETARYFRFNDSTRADQAYEAKSSTHSANAKFYWLGEKGRQRGHATISQVRTNHGPKNRSGLNKKQGSIHPRYNVRVRK